MLEVTGWAVRMGCCGNRCSSKDLGSVPPSQLSGKEISTFAPWRLRFTAPSRRQTRCSKHWKDITTCELPGVQNKFLGNKNKIKCFLKCLALELCFGPGFSCSRSQEGNVGAGVVLCGCAQSSRSAKPEQKAHGRHVTRGSHLTPLKSLRLTLSPWA